MSKIKLELTLDQVNLVLAAVGKLPYETVFHIVEEFNKQVIPQVRAMNEQAEVGEE